MNILALRSSGSRKLLLSLVLGLLLTALLVWSMAALANPALAATCSVPSGPYPTIQAAINDSSCDLITVMAGAFTENLNIARSLTLQGAGQTATVIDGSSGTRVITVTGAGVVVRIEDLRVTGGDATSAPTSGFGGGIYVGGGATLHGQNLQIDDNVASTSTSGFGGGLAVNGGSAYITGTLVYSNAADLRAGSLTGSGRGGGLYVSDGALYLSDSAVLTNVAAYRAATSDSASGGGLHVNQGAQVYLSGNTWQGNVARGSNSQVCDLATCVGGLDHEGGGAVGASFATGEAVITMTKEVFTGNIANDVNPTSGNNSGRGGAISLNTTNTGGQITATLTDVTLSQNVAATKSNGSGEEGQGGAIFVRHASLTAHRVSIYGNQAAATGAGSGGGIYAREPLAGNDVEVVNGVLVDNLAGGVGRGAQLHLDFDSTSQNALRLVHSTLASANLNPHEALYFNGPTAGDFLGITNTIIASHTAGIVNVNATGYLSGRYLLFFGNIADQPSPGTTAFPDTSTWMSGDPAFINPPGNDYHLGSASQAIDKGADVGVTVDRDGQSRPFPTGGAFDIGAYEWPYLATKVYLPLVVKP